MRNDEIIKGSLGNGTWIAKHGCVYLVYTWDKEGDYGKRIVCHTEEEAIKVYNEAV